MEESKEKEKVDFKLEDVLETVEKEEFIIRKKLKEKPGMSRILLIVYKLQPTTIRKICTTLKIYSRRQAKYIVDQLSYMGLVSFLTPTDAFMKEENSPLLKQIREDWRREEKKMMTVQIARKLRSTIKYYFLSEYGEGFLRFCCEMNKIPYFKAGFAWKDEGGKSDLD